ncbi:MAG: PQQ-binding-like beta-propeller repeat protein, partial [Bacillota bacterium]
VAALKPDLVIHTGDVTEIGSRREYEEYRQAIAVFGNTPVLHVPGNHDARWLDPGKAWFRQYLGEVPRTLDWHGVHLVLLDSTVATETHGHLDRSTLQWLAGHLQRVGPDRPVLVFLHHPVFYTPVTYTDTDDEFVAVLAPYNVRGVFTGHGHLHMRWERNGIPFFMTQAAMEGGYKIVDLDPAARTLTVYDGNVDSTLTEVVTLPLDPPTPRPAPPVITRVALEGNHLRVEARVHGLPSGLQYWARVGTTPWQPMGPSLHPDTLMANLPVAGLPPGRHRVQVWIAPLGAALPGELLSGDQWPQRNAGPSWSAYQDVDLPPAPGAADAPRELWRLGFGGGIQGSPALGPDGTAYAATLAGEVVAVAPDGQVRWRREFPAPVVGAPTLVPDGSGSGAGGPPGSGLLLVPGTDGTLRALDPASGEVRWQAHLGAPLMAQPLAAAGLVFIGDSAGVLHALDLATGAPRWQYQAGAAIRSRAAYGAGTVFVGAWDTAVHAVDAFTGKPRWVRTLPGSVYYSPANQPPLFFRGRVYVTRSQPSGHASLYALDARTGEVLWSAQGSFGYSAPVLHGGLLVVASSGGTVVAFDPVTGQQRWSVATGVTAYDGAITSFAGDLALAGLGGEVALVRPGGGSAGVRKYRVGSGYLFARPVADEGRLLVAGLDGSLVALTAPAAPAQPLDQRLSGPETIGEGVARVPPGGRPSQPAAGCLPPQYPLPCRFVPAWGCRLGRTSTCPQPVLPSSPRRRLARPASSRSSSGRGPTSAASR